MTHPWWLHYEGEQPTIDDLPTSSRAAEVRTALNMVDREREEREKLRAEVERLRGELDRSQRDAQHWLREHDRLKAELERLRKALEVLARDTPARPGSVIAREALDA